MNRYAVLALLLAWSWVVMTVVHELGHVVAGCACGGTLSQLELRPWHLPYSFFSNDPYPAITLWAGPLIGSLIPLLLAAMARKPAIWFIAWFCVVANGVYLLLGWFAGNAELDSTKIIAAGTPSWMLVMVAIAMSVAGYVGLRGECQRVLDAPAPVNPAPVDPAPVDPAPDVQDLDDPSRRMKKRTFGISLGALIVVIVVQSAVGSLQ